MNWSTKIPLTSISAIFWILSLFGIFLVFTSIYEISSVEAKYVFSKKWAELGTDTGKFNNPHGIAIDSSGRLYVADTGNNRIQQFRLATPCPSGTTQIVSGVCFVRAWGTPGTGNGQFNNPTDVALDSAGRVYVTDNGNHRIQMFKGTGAFMKAWSTDGPGTAQFYRLIGIAVDASTNDIYAIDNTSPPYVHKFRLTSTCPTGTTQAISGVCFISKWEIGDYSEPPHFKYTARGIAVNSLTHEVFVSAETAMANLQLINRYTSDGTELIGWGDSADSTDGKFDGPTGIAINSQGLVYVADTYNHRIQTFRLANPCPSDTTQVAPGVCFVTKWGTPGSANGQFSIPIDVAIGGPSGLIYVLDNYNNRIQEFYWKTDVGGPGGGGPSPNIAVK